MRTHITLLVIFSVFANSLLLSAEKPAVPGWSEVKVLVVEDATGKPAVGGRVEHTCAIAPYFGKPFETDSNGVARVMIFRTWVGLRATGNGLTNSVLLVGTNAVARFCANAIIRLKQAANERRANNFVQATPVCAILFVLSQVPGVLDDNRSAKL
jgi:hypothetical protein